MTRETGPPDNPTYWELTKRVIKNIYIAMTCTCSHDWELVRRNEYPDHTRFLYKCKKCPKFKKIRL